MISSADVGAKLKGTSVANEIARTCAHARSMEELHAGVRFRRVSLGGPVTSHRG
jgi:hypothetical protein